MRVILLERIRNLGLMGDMVEVKPGYARNFLLPQKKALRATEENIKVFESRKKILEAENLKLKTEAEKVRDRVKDLYICLERNAGESGHLYGSVTDRDIAEASSAKGFKITRKQVYLNAPIKQAGVHKVIIALHPEVEMNLLLSVAPSLEEAEAAIKAALSPAKEEQKSEPKAATKPAKKARAAKTEEDSEADQPTE